MNFGTLPTMLSAKLDGFSEEVLAVIVHACRCYQILVIMNFETLSTKITQCLMQDLWVFKRGACNHRSGGLSLLSDSLFNKTCHRLICCFTQVFS